MGGERILFVLYHVLFFNIFFLKFFVFVFEFLCFRLFVLVLTFLCVFVGLICCLLFFFSFCLLFRRLSTSPVQ